MLSSISTNIDLILYINLSHRKDRKQNIETEILKLGRHGTYHNNVERIDAIFDINNGHRGAAKSHINALKFAIKKYGNDIKNVLILEDDFIFYKNSEEINTLLTRFFNEFRENEWDVLMFTSYWTNAININKDYLKQVRSATVAAAYLINIKYIHTLLNNFEESFAKMSTIDLIGQNKECYDAIDQYWFRLQEKDNWFIFDPHLGNSWSNSNYISDINNDFTLEYNLVRDDLDFPFSYIIDNNNNKIKNIIVINGPCRSDNELQKLLDFKYKGYYILGISSYQNFPRKIINPIDYTFTHNFDIFSNKEYYEHIIGWCYCERNPEKYLPLDLPKMLWAESDIVDEKNIKKYINKTNKIYDFVYVCLEGAWNNFNREWELAKKCINTIVNDYNLKILLIGRKNEDDCPIHDNITSTNFLNYYDFLKELSKGKNLLVTNIFDASPRIVAEALILDIPIFENINIIGGWHYINNKTGMTFNDFDDFNYKLSTFLNNHNEYTPHDWYLQNYNNNISKRKLAWFINSLPKPLYRAYDILEMKEYIFELYNIDKLISTNLNSDILNNNLLFRHTKCKTKINKEIIHYLNLFLEKNKKWDIIVLNADSKSSISNSDYLYFDELIEVSNVSLFIINKNYLLQQNINFSIHKETLTLELNSNTKSYVLNQNLWVMNNTDPTILNFKIKIISNNYCNKSITKFINKNDHIILEYLSNSDKYLEKINSNEWLEIINNNIISKFNLQNSSNNSIKIFNNKLFINKHINYDNDFLLQNNNDTLKFTKTNEIFAKKFNKWNKIDSYKQKKHYYLWHYIDNDDYFKEIENEWVEYKKETIFAKFKELHRNNDEILLYDKDRDLYIKLKLNICYFSFDNLNWQKLNDGITKRYHIL